MNDDAAVQAERDDAQVLAKDTERKQKPSAALTVLSRDLLIELPDVQLNWKRVEYRFLVSVLSRRSGDISDHIAGLFQRKLNGDDPTEWEWKLAAGFGGTPDRSISTTPIRETVNQAARAIRHDRQTGKVPEEAMAQRKDLLAAIDAELPVEDARRITCDLIQGLQARLASLL